MLYAMDTNKASQNHVDNIWKLKTTVIITIYKCILIINVCDVKGGPNYFLKQL